jgi:hypothetical protein
MRKDVLSSRYQGVFAKARARHECLAPYHTTADLLRGLTNERAGHEYRDCLSRAVLREHRSRTSPVWSELLVVAYYPMLSCLRYRVIREDVPGDDLDQLLLCAFLGTIESLSRLKEPNRIALHLHRDTARALFLVLRRQRSEALDPEELEGLASGATPSRSLEHAQACEFMAGELRRTLARELADTTIEVLAATVLGFETSSSLAERLYGDGVSQSRAYQRIKRQRTRALDQLRVTLQPSDLLFESLR